jgi:hypothetical protein
VVEEVSVVVEVADEVVAVVEEVEEEATKARTENEKDRLAELMAKDQRRRVATIEKIEM